MHTPASTVGTQAYQFDLRLTTANELSGWLTLTFTGFYGAAERSSFLRLNANDARSQMSEIVRGFFSGAEVLDIERPDAPWSAPFTMRAYFVVPGAANAGDRKYTLSFPSRAGIFTDLGDQPERETPFFMYNDRITVAATIALPKGLHPVRVPPAFQFAALAGSSRAQWTFADGSCHADLEIEIRQTVLKPPEFGSYYQGQQSLHAWLKESVVLVPDASAPEQVAAETTELDLPILSNGASELDLVDQRYPDSGNPEMRRLALERTIQNFPLDKDVVFRAGVRLALIDWNAHRYAAAHDRLASLLAAYAGQLKPETYGWAEAVDGEVLRDLDRFAEARAKLERVARNKELSDFRRATAVTSAADLMTTAAPADALALLLEVAQLPGGRTDGVESRIAHLMLRENQDADLRRHLADLAQAHPDSAEESLAGLLNSARAWKSKDDAERLGRLADFVAGLRPAPGAALAKAIDDTRLEVASRLIHSRLAELAQSGPLAPWYQPYPSGHPLSLDDARRAIDKAVSRSDAAQCLKLAVQSLVAHGVEDEFPFRLWDAAADAEWLERQQPSAIDPQVADSLIELCEQLPPSEQYHTEGRLLRAKRLAQSGRQEAARLLYREILAVPHLGNNFVAAACLALGVSLEQGGDYVGALEVYRQAEPATATYPRAADCQLHAVFLNLHLGHDDEALRVIRVLEQAGEEAVKKSASPAQLREFITLAHSGQALECWKAGRAWWPQWQAFMKNFAVATEAADCVVPVTGTDPVQIASDLHSAGSASDSKKYFATLNRLVSAGRWLPSNATIALANTTANPPPATEHAGELNDLAIVILGSPLPASLGTGRERQPMLVTDLAARARFTEAEKVIAAFNARTQPPDQVTENMHRVQAQVAVDLKRGLEAAAANLESDLVTGCRDPSRELTVVWLASVYGKLGRKAEARALLTRELANPIIQADPTVRADLQWRAKQADYEEDFSGKLQAWVKAVPLRWYDYVEPRSLDDPRLSELDEVLKNGRQVFNPSEAVKLDLLAAQDPRRVIGDRLQSWQRALNGIFDLTDDCAQAAAIAAPLVHDTDLNEEIRLVALFKMLDVLAQEGRREEYAIWRKEPIFQRFNPHIQEYVQVLDDLVAVDRTSTAELLKLSTRLAERELSQAGGLAEHRILDLLIRKGDLQAAEALVATVPDWKFSADSNLHPEALQLNLAREVRTARLRGPVHEAMTAVVLASYPNPPSRLPPEFAHRRLVPNLFPHHPAATFDACRYLVATHQFNRTDFTFWYVLLSSAPRNADTAAFNRKMLAAGLAAAADDSLRGELIGMFASSIDIDDPTERQQLIAAFEPYRRQVENPASYAAIRSFECTLAARLGEPADFDAMMSSVSLPKAADVARRLTLRLAVQKGDLPDLKRRVDALDSNFLLDPTNLPVTLPALEALKRDDEVKIARDTARRFVHRALAESWTGHNPWLNRSIVGMIELIHDPDELPPEWLADLAARNSDPRALEYALVVKGVLENDWIAAEKHASNLLAEYPTQYHYYWYEGLALARLQRKPEARAALQIYLKYSHEELDYPKAQALLKDLETSTP